MVDHGVLSWLYLVYIRMVVADDSYDQVPYITRVVLAIMVVVL